MKTAGWIFIVIGVLAFLGAASKGHSVFGPLFWIGIGSVLIYLKREKEVTNAEKAIVKPIEPKQPEKTQVREEKAETNNVEQCALVTFEQKEAALCLIAFIWFGIGNYKETLTAALPKYQDADKLIDTVLTIKDRKSREFILLTCYDLTKMSGKAEAFEFLYNIANEMGYDKERLHKLIDQYSERPTHS